MSNLEKVRSLWDAHEHDKFPSGFTGKVYGVDLFVANAEIGACIVAFITTGGKLSPHWSSTVKQRLAQTAPAVEKIDGPGRSYFDRLISMAKMVAAECDS